MVHMHIGCSLSLFVCRLVRVGTNKLKHFRYSRRKNAWHFRIYVGGCAEQTAVASLCSVRQMGTSADSAADGSGVDR